MVEERDKIEPLRRSGTFVVLATAKGIKPRRGETNQAERRDGK